MSDSFQPHRLYSPWNSPGQNTGVGSLSLLQGDLPKSGINPRSPALQADSLPSELLGKPLMPSIAWLVLVRGMGVNSPSLVEQPLHDKVG